MSVHSIPHWNGTVPDDAHPDILLMLRYWQYAHAAGRLPSFADFILDDVPALRPHIRLIDVVSGGSFKYRVREIGQEHLRHLGYDPRGSWYETIAPNYANSIVELDLARVCRERMPIYRKGKSVVAYVSGNRCIERVHLPLSTDGNTVDGIATLTLFFPSLRPKAGAGRSSSKLVTPGDATLLMPDAGSGLVFPVAASFPTPAVPLHVS